MAVVNFAPRQIGPVMSEILVLGFPDAEGAIVLAQPEQEFPTAPGWPELSPGGFTAARHPYIRLIHLVYFATGACVA